MPNKYEREIEEILRNMERTEPKASLGQKFGGRLRRKSDQLRNGWSHLNRWVEEQHLLEIEALTFNGKHSDTWP